MTTQEIIQTVSEDMKNNRVRAARTRLANLLIMYKKFDPKEVQQYKTVIKDVRENYPELMDDFNNDPALISLSKTRFTKDDMVNAVAALKVNFCEERIRDAITIGKALYAPAAAANTAPRPEVKPQNSKPAVERPPRLRTKDFLQGMPTAKQAPVRETPTVKRTSEQSGGQRTIHTEGETGQKKNEHVSPLVPALVAAAAIAAVIWYLVK